MSKINDSGWKKTVNKTITAQSVLNDLLAAQSGANSMEDFFFLLEYLEENLLLNNDGVFCSSEVLELYQLREKEGKS